MARFDQLEIVAPDGSIAFHDLDPAKGVTNLGRDAENDIVIDSPQVAPFLAMIDHRDLPYQIMILDQGGKVLLDGQPLQPNLGRDLQTWSTVEIAGYSLVLVEHEPVSAAAPTTQEKQRAAAIGVTSAALAGAAAALGPAAPGVAAALSPQRLALPPADHLDDIIVVELAQRAWTIDCDQTASFPLTMINGGNIVASFEIALEGLDPEWIIIEPPTVNLNEGERASATIAITPPRVPASRAGAHHFAVIVTSPDYPGHVSRLGATLTLNPFFDFAISDLSPRQNYTTWKKRTALATVTLTNKGNSDALFRIDGEDDQRGCAFEFQQAQQGAPGGPPSASRSARQAEVRLPPESVSPISVFITPTKRRLIGFRKHAYSLTLTGTPQNGQSIPRSILGQLQASPLIGPWILLLMITLAALLIILIFRPTIDGFGLPSSNGQAVTWGSETSIDGGKPVTLSWSTSPFVQQLKLYQEIKTSTGATTLQEVGSVAAPTGSQILAPPQSVRYLLVANNLLSNLLTFLEKRSDWVTVNVTPVPPQIMAFNTLPISLTQIVQGQSADLTWQVSGADKLMLIGNDGVKQPVPTDTGTIKVSPLGSTVYNLNASNGYGTAESQSINIAVVTPTPTPIPKPVIMRFSVDPRVITVGQSVNIVWQVDGLTDAGTVNITGIPGSEQYPPQGNLAQSPTANVNYGLIATNGGAKAQMGPISVEVKPAPQPPVINFFSITPNQVVRGSAEAAAVSLQWQVSGPTTDITLSGPNLDLRKLSAQGTISVTADKTAIYVLTAINGPTNDVKTGQITVLEPTPTPLPTNTPTPPTPTPTPFPPPVIVFFNAEEVEGVVTRNSGASTATTQVYTVVAGTNVTFSWQVGNTTLLLFDGAPKPAVPDTIDSTNQVVKQSKFYELKAANTGPTIVTRFVQVVMSPKSPPPPPYNVTGTYTPTEAPPTVIRWEYSLSDAKNYGVVGFRVYRANVPEYLFLPVGDVMNLTEMKFSDPLDGTSGCNKAYYVVALIRDVDGITLIESTPSTNSWYSPPCP